MKAFVLPGLGRQSQVDLWEFAAGLHSQFQDSQGYTEKLCLTKQNKIKKKKNHLVVNKVYNTCRSFQTELLRQ